MSKFSSTSLSALNKTVIFRLILGALIILAFPVWSQTNLSRPVLGRYLLIVETSRPMSHRSDGTIKTFANLLFSGMGGQIHQGDTIGVWTYNKDLYTGRLPLQRWSTLEQRDICSTILNFIKGQKYENQPAFSSVRATLEKVVKESELITVILVSSGEEKMLGTPFDDQINQLYNNWREEQQKSRMPFVTVLRAKRGTIIGYSVTPAPWQVELPAWPAEPVAKAAPEPTPPPPKVQPSTVPPLIVTGKKPKPAETTNSTGVVAPTPGNATPAASNPAAKVITNVPTESSASEPSHALSSPGALTNQPETALLQRKVERPTETPQHPPEPTPTLTKEPIVSGPTNRPATAAPVVANNSNSNPPPVVAAQKSAPPPQEISTGVTTPENGPLSNKIIWIGGLAVLGIVCVILIVLARRPRSRDISLITRSLEREEKR